MGSLLPPDRAVGSFTKVVQRVPVKITMDDAGPLAGHLLPGLSTEVAVDTAVVDP
jgi:membrane fusion protein (multidrug efflux system)